MEKQNVFAEEKELGRLSTQNRLIYFSEQPIFRELFAGKKGLSVLDVGCNDGEKTFRWFSVPEVSRVIGLELDESLAAHAQAHYGGERFGFYPCDADAEDFPACLEAILQREGVRRFDVIYISYLLSHLRAPEALLRQLRPLLKEDGVLVAVESNDELASLTPEDGRFREFLDMLAEDPYAGDRTLGGRLPRLLTDCGFHNARLRCTAIGAGPGEEETKEKIFRMFFSYLPEDIAILRAASPADARYARWERWIDEHYAPLRAAICAPDSRVSMGMAVVTCTAERS